MNKKGITLIAVILLMTLLAITVVGLTTFVIERLRLVTVRQNEINAYYMAQAGIHYGIYQYRKNSTLFPNPGAWTTYDGYGDRKFEWCVSAVSDNEIIITVDSKGYAPKTGSNQILKKLRATYDTDTEKVTSMENGANLF